MTTGHSVVTAAIREARRSVAALLLEVPEGVWREHKGVVENAIVEMEGENAALRKALRESLTLIRAEALEEAARIAEAYDGFNLGRSSVTESIAARIRAAAVAGNEAAS